MFFTYNYLTHLLEANTQVLEYFKWSGSIVAFLAAIAISVLLTQTIWPFILYIIANLIWLKAAKIMKDRPLVWMQIFLLGINSYAVWLRV